MEEKRFEISAPWVVYYRRIEALFAQDPEVTVVYDEETLDIKVFVDNLRKYDAISAILPQEKTFGNVTVKVTVIPANTEEEVTWAELFREAFAGNPIFAFSDHCRGSLGEIDYIVFCKGKAVAQYFSDNLFDINGITTELYQDIAKEVFETGNDAVAFCTDTNL